MNAHYRILLIMAMMFVLTACHASAASNQRAEFVEAERDVEPYLIRMTANPHFLRIDEGEGANGYILYDRQKKTIININTSLQTVMLVAPPPSELQPPFALTHVVKDLGPLKDAPKINNTTPIHYQFLTNEQLCMDVISVPGLLPELVQALKEYQLLLAADSARTFNLIPADLQTPCEITGNTFSPIREYSFGFPIREWRPSGYSRALKDYQATLVVNEKFYAIPKEYFTYTIEQLRDGQVDMQNRKILTPASAQAANQTSK